MARVLFFVTTVITACAASIGCRTDTATQEQLDTRKRPEAITDRRAASVPQSAADRAIHRDLKLAIAQDAILQAREISFVVTNGDVSVTGTVNTEDERTRINDVAMRIAGVKSVANALRVAE